MEKKDYKIESRQTNWLAITCFIVSVILIIIFVVISKTNYYKEVAKSLPNLMRIHSVWGIVIFFFSLGFYFFNEEENPKGINFSRDISSVFPVIGIVGFILLFLLSFTF